jgi:glycosyltransferase involved in cell wall biosynthesis
MKILHISTEDTRPGAARATYRLNSGLNKLGISSEVLVQNKRSDDGTVHLVQHGGAGRIMAETRKLLGKARLFRYPKCQKTSFSTQWLPNGKLFQIIETLNPNLINLHWVCDNFLQIESLPKLQRPLVWTLRDMWPFTGGCHYDQGCKRYTESCGMCPQLVSNHYSDLSASVLKRKLTSWQTLDLTLVALSSWIGNCAASSALFKDRRVEVIPNGLDTDLYKPADRQVAREILNLPGDKKLVLFGAVQATSSKRKGFDLLKAALKDLSETVWKEKIELVVFGSSKPEHSEDFGFKTYYLGHLYDDFSLVMAYSAANVLVAPSVQENLPNTVLEATACGIPSVAFNIGGMPDLIDHEKNGYLAKPFEIRDLAQGIAWILEEEERYS